MNRENNKYINEVGEVLNATEMNQFVIKILREEYIMNYKKIYFRINTPSYYRASYGVGFETKEDGQLFQNIVTQLFLNDGWEVKKDRYMSGGCNTITKDKQELYLHPQSISGVIAENNIIHVENLLSNSELFKFEKTDIYDDVFDITDEKYLSILKSKKEFIEQDILTIFKTKRSNLYITDSFTPLLRVLDKYKIKRLSSYIGIISSNNIDVQFMCKLFENLVEQGDIITAKTKSGTGYRTKTEKGKKKSA